MPDFNAKMHQNRFRLGLRPRPRWRSLQRSPDPLAGFKGPTSKGRGEEGRGGEAWDGRWVGGEEREGGEEGVRGRKGGEGVVGWSPPCEILNTPLCNVISTFLLKKPYFSANINAKVKSLGPNLPKKDKNLPQCQIKIFKGKRL